MKHTKYVLLLALLTVFGLAQCGGKSSNSQKVVYDVITDHPIVIDADLAVSGSSGTTTITANWFLFGHHMKNNSDNKLYWVTSKLAMAGSSASSGFVQATSTIDPSKYCSSSSSSSTTPKRAYIAILTGTGTSTSEYTHLTDSCDPTTPDAGAASYEQTYFFGLDKGITNWSVNVTNEGFFVNDEEIPIERLTSSGAFSTH